MILNTEDLRKVRSRIALDLGNVLVHVEMEIFFRELVLLDICDSLKQAEEFTASMQHVFDVGVYDLRHGLRLHFPKMANQHLERLREAWYAIVTPCKPTLNVLTDLISEGSSVALLSNVGMDHAEYLSDMCEAQFSHCIKHFSCYVGARKPTKLFYQSFIMDHPEFSEYNINYNFKRGLFLDDRLENVEAGRLYLDAKVFDINNYKSDNDAANALVKIIRDI